MGRQYVEVINANQTSTSSVMSSSFQERMRVSKSTSIEPNQKEKRQSQSLVDVTIQCQYGQHESNQLPNSHLLNHQQSSSECDCGLTGEEGGEWIL